LNLLTFINGFNMREENKLKRKFVPIPPSSEVYEFLEENSKISPVKLFEKVLRFYKENQEISKQERALKIQETANERIREIFPGENLQELQSILWVLTVRAAEGRYDAKKIIQEVNYSP
jgi:hypothetical protein